MKSESIKVEDYLITIDVSYLFANIAVLVVVVFVLAFLIGMYSESQKK